MYHLRHFKKEHVISLPTEREFLNFHENSWGEHWPHEQGLFQWGKGALLPPLLEFVLSHPQNIG